eukprot:6477519-Amphidinium_carterae.4
MKSGISSVRLSELPSSVFSGRSVVNRSIDSISASEEEEHEEDVLGPTRVFQRNYWQHLVGV